MQYCIKFPQNWISSSSPSTSLRPNIIYCWKLAILCQGLELGGTGWWSTYRLGRPLPSRSKQRALCPLLHGPTQWIGLNWIFKWCPLPPTNIHSLNGLIPSGKGQYCGRTRERTRAVLVVVLVSQKLDRRVERPLIIHSCCSSSTSVPPVQSIVPCPAGIELNFLAVSQIGVCSIFIGIVITPK